MSSPESQILNLIRYKFVTNPHIPYPEGLAVTDEIAKGEFLTTVHGFEKFCKCDGKPKFILYGDFNHRPLSKEEDSILNEANLPVKFEGSITILAWSLVKCVYCNQIESGCAFITICKNLIRRNQPQ